MINFVSAGKGLSINFVIFPIVFWLTHLLYAGNGNEIIIIIKAITISSFKRVKRTHSWNSSPSLLHGWNPNYQLCFCRSFRRRLWSPAESRILLARIYHFQRQFSAAFHFDSKCWMVDAAVDRESLPKTLASYAKDLGNRGQYPPVANRTLRALSMNFVPNMDLWMEKIQLNFPGKREASTPHTFIKVEQMHQFAVRLTVWAH